MAKLTESDIRQVANAGSFEKGYSYYHDGYVLSVVQRGEQLTAEVEGSQYRSYQVQVTLQDGRVISADCSCPYDWGGYCKHILAALLYYVHETADIETKPEVGEMLANLTEAQLRQLLIVLAQEQPGVVEVIEREIGWLKQTPTPGTEPGTADPIAADIAAIRRQLRKDFRSSGPSSRYDDYYYDDDYDEYFDPSAYLPPHLTKVDELLGSGDVTSAAAVIKAIIEEWIEGISDFEDWYDFGDLLEEANHDLDQALAEVILSLDLTAEERELWQAEIADWSESVALDMAEMAIKHGWDYPPLVAVLQGHITNKGAWEDEAPWFAHRLANVRLNVLERQNRLQEYLYLAEAEGQTDRYIHMLARVGQTELAVAEARRYFHYPDQILALSRVLQEKKEFAAALELGEHGLTMPEPQYRQSKAPLAQWLSGLAETHKKPELALRAAQEAFLASHELADYTTVQRLAGEQWLQIKEALLESLASTHYSSHKVAIYLHEGMLMAAMRELDKNYQYYHSDLMRVVEAAKEKYPDWCIQKFKNLAEAIMDAGRANDYHTSANWLSRARDIYLLHNRQADWYNYLNSVLDKHSRKYKLVPMLKNIR
jgi:uncharacterized Zn finger protein